jgi:hypothetical protein
MQPASRVHGEVRVEQRTTQRKQRTADVEGCTTGQQQSERSREEVEKKGGESAPAKPPKNTAVVKVVVVLEYNATQ